MRSIFSRGAVLVLAAVALAAPAESATGPSAYDHLRAVVGLSTAPEYRRAGSPGMAAVAGYVAGQLSDDGYAVVRQDFSLRRWVIDYATGHEPLLERDDGTRFKVESGFDLGTTTLPAGITCTVRAVKDAGPGDCGFIPFGDASPEWRNTPFVKVANELDALVAQGAAGAIVQGDVARDLAFSLRVRRPIPTVVAVARSSELLGRSVRLRAIGAYDDHATGHNTIGVLRSPVGSQYVLLLAHADGWFQAAADNGSGTAAVLRAAQILAEKQPGIGVIVAAMDGEEIGLLGADHFAGVLSSDGGLDVGDGGAAIHMDDLKAIVNLDASSARASDLQNAVRALARRDAPVFQWRALVFSEDPVLATAFLARFPARGVLGLPVPASVFRPVSGGSLDSRFRTDVDPFAAAGVPFVWPVSGYPEYHTDGDTLATVDPADLEAIARAAADLAADIARLPVGAARAA